MIGRAGFRRCRRLIDSRRRVQGAALLLAFGCGESRSPDQASGGQGGSSNGGTLSAGANAGEASASGGTSGSGGGGARALPHGGAAGQGGAPSEAGETSSGGATEGGAAGAPGENPDEVSEPVTVIRGDPQGSFVNLTIRGIALDDHEGELVTVRLGRPDRPPERLGSGSARIRDGTFELFFPAVWEVGLYKQKLVHIDVDGDGTCTSARDRLFQDSRGATTPELTVRGDGTRGQYDIAEAEPLSDDEPLCAQINAPWPEE
jgi:hypothetical protein